MKLRKVIIGLVFCGAAFVATYSLFDRVSRGIAASYRKLDLVYQSDTALMATAMRSYLETGRIVPTFTANDLEQESGWGQLPFVARNSNSKNPVRSATPDASQSGNSMVIARRLGDYVFTCQAPVPTPPDLWMVILCFDSRVNSNPWPTGTVSVGLGDGTVRQFVQSDVNKELIAQNLIRAKYGLAPLPDPRTVSASP